MGLLPLPLAGVISLFSLSTPVSVVYRTTAPDSDGFPATTETTVAHEVVLHQASGRDLERATGGRRTDAGLVVFSRGALPEGAHLSYAQPGGAVQRWLIVKSENWVSQAGHYRSWCVSA